MPRRPRLHLDGFPLHIVQRGHNRDRCFLDAQDFGAYLYWLGHALTQSNCALHAYVLMPNHVHLLLTPQVARTVPSLVMSIGRHYVQHFNRKYARTGTLWDSRYKSSLVDTDRYLLACYRYIELNPVRAGIVRTPGEYRWSSYHANALDRSDRLVTAHALYDDLGRDTEQRRNSYRKFFATCEEAVEIEAIRLALNQNQPLADDRFIDTLEANTGTRREPRPRGRPVGSPAAT